ncbi:hypothetical protein AB833_06795 [Chromatiales bacterium (ex Bugula neritina AB1)]|nr:hypothetical protein AB833_06795 [Chromatiales bacterium (ex Bugula neritina AB1)]
MFESLFTEKTPRVVAASQYLANLDSLNHRSLSGWVINKENLDEVVSFDVFLGDLKVGEGTAENYRQDLQEVGYGNGNHGFLVGLSSQMFSAGRHDITLRESTTGALISSNKFSVRNKADFVAEVIGFGNRVVLAQIWTGGGSKKDPSSVEILVDGNRRLPCALSNNAGEKLNYAALIPDELFDGMPHAFEIIANDANVSSTAYVDILHPIVTPDEHLSDSLGQPGYIGLSRNAGFRYESLTQHMTQFSANDSLAPEEISNLCQAHKEVVRGAENRREFARLTLPEVSEPDVSIIVPAKDNFPITYHCIASLILSHNHASFEVILVDDESSDETTAAEEIIENLVVVRNAKNLGFVMANNKAAQMARGKYICLLNNDTEVTGGWIDQALEMFELYNGVGSVGCKLVYPDGSLQEAGGVVWNSGVPWNYGKNQNASHPSYNYSRQADYLSAAALFIDRSVWQKVGGFSEEYAPAYYEDTDLAFKIRSAGHKTLYCPTSVVIHYEGKSNGTSTKSGIKRFQELNSKTFRAKWFADYKSNGEEGKTPHLEVDRDNNFRVLVLDAETPRRNSDAGSYAAFQEMKLMMELGCKLTFIPSNLAHMGKHTEHLQKLGVECIYYPFYQSIDQFLKLRGEEFDAVYITRYQIAANNLDSIAKYTKAKTIFNNADLHFLRELREQLQSGDKDFSGPLATKAEELEVINEVDVAICYTEAERAVITSHVLKEENIMRCPWVVKTNGRVQAFSQRKDIAFLGGYRHQPNVEAVEYFCKNVMPVLSKRMPDVVFRVYGSSQPVEFKQFESSNVVMEGFVEDLADVYDNVRLFVSPLLSGAGLKGKIIDCMAAGLPSVISPITAEGTGLVHSQSTYIADSVDEWCSYIEELYTDEALWNKMSANSVSIAESLYSPAEGYKRMKKILEAVDVFACQRDQGKFKGYIV